MHPVSYRCLVLNYVEKIQLLGQEAEHGKDVKLAIETVINDACTFFLHAIGCDPVSNIALLKKELAYRATYAQNSQLEYRVAFKYAASLIAA